MPTSNPSLPTRRVCPWILRAQFNKDQFVRQVAEGQLIADPEPGTPPDPRYRLPNGTLSHTVWIKTLSGDILYRTHVYVCPHGDYLGPDGFLDPKRLTSPTEILTVENRRHTRNSTCTDCGTWRLIARRAAGALRAYSRRCQICP